MYEKKELVSGIAWGEGLRWHDRKLYWSDIFGKKVSRTDLDGNVEKLADIPAMPSGLGIMPDESLLIVSCGDQKIMKWTPEGLNEYADMKGSAVCVNDMVVDGRGIAYVGAYGFDILHYTGGPAEGWIIITKPGEAPKAAGQGVELMAPNGMVITEDGKTLVVADTMGKQFIAYDIDADGDISNGRVWAKMEYGPDGICIDAEDAVWAAVPNNSEVVHVKEGGEILERIPFDDTPLCCTLGGEDRKTLFVVTVPAHKDLSPEDLSDPEKQQAKAGSKISMIPVAVAGAGRP